MQIGVENPLISIIVPVYNVEKYLRKCVGTLAGQTYKNIEIILVDDGSTDACPAICDETAEADARIKVLHTANGGQSAARNMGIEVSKGNYITFVDGDDYVTAGYVLHLYELMEERRADISITNYRLRRDDGEEINEEKINNEEERPSCVLFMDRHEALETFLYRQHFMQLPGGKLFRRSLFDDIEFPEGKVAEDLGIFYKLLDRAELVAYSSAVDYIYVQRLTSTMHAQGDRVENDALIFLEEMTRYIISKYPDLREAIAYYCFFFSFHNLKQVPFQKIYEKKRAKVRNNIIKYRKSVLANPKVSFSTRCYAALSYLGIGTLWVCKAIYDRVKFL
jgi:glycosyltransferase involved in cell wall biosynthesis